MTDASRNLQPAFEWESTVEETAQRFLARIERVDPRIGAFLALEPDLLRQARAIDERLAGEDPPPPLAGVLIGVKDLILARGLPTTGGSRARHPLDRENRDAGVIHRLKQAGALVIGKQSLHEFAFGITNENEHFGAVHNPWNLNHVSGGSSGGSAAAVAAGLCHAAIGTDTRGSIRIPASCCGICGLKPTFGAVDIDGVIPLSPSLDHVGPLARTVEEIAAVYGVMSLTYDSQPPLGPAPVLGWSEPFFETISPDVERTVLAAMKEFEDAGLEVRRVELDLPFDEVLAASDVISRSEAYEFHEGSLRKTPFLYGPKVRQRLLSGAELTAADFVRALRLQSQAVEAFEKLFRQIDCLLAPTTPIPAPLIGTTVVEWPQGNEGVVPAMVRLVATQNMGHVPALSLPCGFSSDGLPIGLQMISARNREKSLLELGRLYQSRTSWHQAVPPGF